MKRKIKIEKEFNKFVGSVNGKLVSDIVGQNPNFSNADYIFESDKIIVELKCLEDDKLKDKAITEKIISLYKKWKTEGHDVSIEQNSWRSTITNLPNDLSLEILKIYAKSIRKRVIKANKQIKETKIALNRKDYKGVLLLANDGNLALDPEHLHVVINYVLGNNYSSINAIIIFTVNQLASSLVTNADQLIWHNLNRAGLAPINNDFFDKLSHGWMFHMDKLLGYDTYCIQLKDKSGLSSMVNLNKDITIKSI